MQIAGQASDADRHIATATTRPPIRMILGSLGTSERGFWVVKSGAAATASDWQSLLAGR
jgi:hypothetical protein